MKKVACPFCKQKEDSKRGDGCCNCEHTGMVPFGEDCHFKTEEEAINHDPEVSYWDLKYRRLNNIPFDFN